MKKKIKGRFILIVILGGFAALNVLAYNHARAMMHYARGGERTSKPEALSLAKKAKVLLMGVNVPRPVSGRSPSELSAGCQTLRIKCSDGVTLGAWYANSGTGTPLVVLFHGYGAEKSCLLPDARAFLELGMSVLLVDFRGSGDSSEAYTTIGFDEAKDVAAVMQYVHAHLPHSSVVLFGQSMGSVAILRAIHEDGVAPDAIVIEAVFDTMLNTVRNRFHAMGIPSFPGAELLVFWGGGQTGFNAFRHNPVAYARSVRCPALFMHGAKDPRATLAEGHRVFDSVPALKQFMEFPSVGHETYVSRFPVEWKQTVGDFLKQASIVH